MEASITTVLLTRRESIFTTLTEGRWCRSVGLCRPRIFAARRYEKRRDSRSTPTWKKRASICFFVHAWSARRLGRRAHEPVGTWMISWGLPGGASGQVTSGARGERVPPSVRCIGGVFLLTQLGLLSRFSMDWIIE